MQTNHRSAEELEDRANRERTQVENTFTEVRRNVRREMDPGVQVRRRPAAAYGLTALASFVAGYGLIRAIK